MSQKGLNMPAKVNLDVYQGATFRHSFRWLHTDEITPVDLSGFTARLQARDHIDSQPAVITLTTSNGGLNIDPAAGKITVHMSAETTAGIFYRRLVYDLEIVAPNGDVRRLIMGKISVSPEVTKI